MFSAGSSTKYPFSAENKGPILRASPLSRYKSKTIIPLEAILFAAHRPVGDDHTSSLEGRAADP